MRNKSRGALLFLQPKHHGFVIDSRIDYMLIPMPALAFLPKR